MMHVVTVHFMDDRWIGPQLRFLKRNLPAEHRVYGCLNGIDPAWSDVFHATYDLEGKHADKLNELARIVTRSGAAPEDLLVFIDGDAFPIAPVDSELLNGTPLAAVRQDECNGDKQPHPSFCLTTVGFWNEIGGDWRQGYQWEVEMGGTMTDVGGNLLGILERNNITWQPLLRSNPLPPEDPMLFGIYADVVYHHGAGFRVPKSRQMIMQSRQAVLRAASDARTPAWVPVVGRVERSARYRLADYRHRKQLSGLAGQANTSSDEVFRKILTDDEFYKELR
jgi:hypothetical protein